MYCTYADHSLFRARAHAYIRIDPSTRRVVDLSRPSSWPERYPSNPDPDAADPNPDPEGKNMFLFLLPRENNIVSFLFTVVGYSLAILKEAYKQLM